MKKSQDAIRWSDIVFHMKSCKAVCVMHDDEIKQLGHNGPQYEYLLYAGSAQVECAYHASQSTS